MGVKHYDKSFKEQTVKLSQQRGNINAVARELGVSSSQLSKRGSDMKVYKEPELCWSWHRASHG